MIALKFIASFSNSFPNVCIPVMNSFPIILFVRFCWSCFMFNLWIQICFIRTIYASLYGKKASFFVILKFSQYSTQCISELSWIFSRIWWLIHFKAAEWNLLLRNVTTNIFISAQTNAYRKQCGSTIYENETNLCIWVDISVF